MTHREILAAVAPIIRGAFPGGRAALLLSEVDRWCEGDFAGRSEDVGDYPCSFCRRPPSETRLLLGISADLAPDGTVRGARFHMVFPPEWIGEEETTPPFPQMICDDCVRAYESSIDEDTMTGRARPQARALLDELVATLRAANADPALVSEILKRYAWAAPLEVTRGTCSLCRREHDRVVQGETVKLCGRCIGVAREELRLGGKR